MPPRDLGELETLVVEQGHTLSGLGKDVVHHASKIESLEGAYRKLDKDQQRIESDFKREITGIGRMFEQANEKQDVIYGSIKVCMLMLGTIMLCMVWVVVR